MENLRPLYNLFIERVARAETKYIQVYVDVSYQRD